MLGDGYRVLAALFSVDGHVQFLAEDLQLRDSGRTVDVGCNHERALALGLQLLSQFGSCRRLAGALEADEHDDGRWLGGDGNPALCPAEEFRQFIADNLDDRLRRVEAAENFFADGLFFYFLDEIFGDGKVDVRFQKGAAHLFQRFADILFRKLPFAAEFFKCRLESFGQTFKWHKGPPSITLFHAKAVSLFQGSAVLPGREAALLHRFYPGPHRSGPADEGAVRNFPASGTHA